MVFGLALVVLLQVRLSDARVGGHVDAGLGAANAGSPGAGGVGDVALLVEFGGVLAEVPDIAL